MNASDYAIKVRFAGKVLFVLVTFLSMGGPQAVEPLTNWSPRIPPRAGVASLAYGNGIYVGYYGHPWITNSILYVSTDRKGWQSYFSGVRALRSVTFNGERFVALAATGEVVFSSDGVKWETTGTIIPGNPNVIAFGNGLYVAVGSEGIFTSPNAVDWTFRAPAIGELLRLKFAEDRFIGCGKAGVVVTSMDGISWESDSIGDATVDLSDVAHGNGVTVVVGNFQKRLVRAHLKPDQGWQTEYLDDPRFVYPEPSIAFGQGKFVIAADGGFRVSTNGSDWESIFPELVHSWISEISSLVFDGNHFVNVDSQGAVASSNDGYQWALHKIVPLSPIEIVGKGTYGGGKFVIPKVDGGLVVSSDGVEWRRVKTPWCTYTDPTGQFYSDTKAADIAYGVGKYVAISPQGSLVSTNAIDWALRPEPTGYEIEFGDGKFVALNATHAQVSTDGLTWTSKSAQTGIENLVFGINSNEQGLFVGTGRGGSALTSTNGLDWKLTKSPVLAKYSYSGFAASGNGLFVVTAETWEHLDGRPGTLWINTSSDGISWITNSLTVSTSDPIQMTFAYDRFLIVMGDKLFTSRNGIEWDVQKNSLGVTFYYVYGGGSLLAAEVFGGGVWQSGMLPRIEIERANAANAAVKWSGEPGIRLERSTNLVDWLPLDVAEDFPGTSQSSRGFVRGVWK